LYLFSVQFDINYSDPSFYSEIDLVKRRFENSLMAYRFILDRFKEADKATTLTNMEIPEMLLYQSVLFDKVKLTAHSLSYLEESGQLAQKLKDILSSARFKFDLFEDQDFNVCFECVYEFFELLTQSYSKLSAMRRVYQEDLIHLLN